MKVIYLSFALLVLEGCTSKKSAAPSFDLAAYQLEIESWHQKRVEELKGPIGFLNLVGLYWLHDGINTFGSGEKNTIIFPEGKIAARAGFFLLKNNIVTLEAAPGVDIKSNGQKIKTLVAYHPDSAKAPKMEHESLQWFIIKRDDKFGIRLRDFRSSELEKFQGIERYPVDAAWRLEANFVRSDSSKRIDITNVLGQTTSQPSPGTLIFTIREKEYHLDALDEGGDDYFMIFGDATNTKETYGAGRYLYVDKPDSSGHTIIDFNKAYNPPCAFTAFATCPLPPRQNIMDIQITAGEKNYGTLH